MFDLSTIGKWIVIAGIVAIVLGGLVWVAGRAGLPLGHLPGDVRVERPGVSIFVPCASMIMISIVLTIVLNVLLRLVSRR